MRNWVKVFFLLLAFSEDLLASPISLDHGKPVSLLTRNFDSDKSVLVMLGELAFKSETLLSPSRSFAIPLSCDSCHPDGGTTQILFVEGLSGKPGTIDITNRALTIYEDGTFNPVNVPSIFGARHTEPYSRAGNFASLREFTRFVIVEEFGGMEPTNLTLDALVAYEESLNFLTNNLIMGNGSLQENASISAKRGELIFTRPFPGNSELSCATCHDPKRYFIDGKKHDVGTGLALDTPTLRDLSISAPYMHDGRFDTINEVLSYFNEQYNLGLDSQDLDDLRTYLGVVGGGKTEIEKEATPLRLESVILLLTKTLEAKDWALGKMVTDQALVEISIERVGASAKRKQILDFFTSRLGEIDSFNKVENYERSLEILEGMKGRIASP